MEIHLLGTCKLILETDFNIRLDSMIVTITKIFCNDF